MAALPVEPGADATFKPVLRHTRSGFGRAALRAAAPHQASGYAPPRFLPPSLPLSSFFHFFSSLNSTFLFILLPPYSLTL
jgi:hypothetical protein